MEVPGFGEDFDSTIFRANIKNVMKMAAPTAVEERVTFLWDDVKTYTGPTDPSGKPYQLDAATASVEETENVQIDCAVEIVDRVPSGTPIGEFNNPRATITVLDNDYALIEGSSKCLIGGNTYNINYVEPIGLFDVTVYIIRAQAQDEA